jgi:hypothetical protein
MNKTRIFYSKAIYVGFVVLELSKRHTYNFHYDHMLKDFNPKGCKALLYRYEFIYLSNKDKDK